MSARSPYVSICLPVYNGERYVRYALQSSLAQTFENFELIISDNASTDATGDMCRSLVAQDHRVRYFRSDVNRGLAWNFNRAFELARGRYLMWLGHDDVIAPDYVARCVEALERDVGTVLCFANPSYIDGEGSLLQRVNVENTGGSDKPTERFNRILWEPKCHPICGLMDVESLRHTRLHGAYADSDRVLLIEMAFRGRFHHLQDHLFSRRQHPQRATTLYDDKWSRSVVFDPSKAGKAICPWWLETIALAGAIRRAGLPAADRVNCYRTLCSWGHAHRRFLRWDVTRAATLLARRAFSSRVSTGPSDGKPAAAGKD